jgi:hypothetical protein
MNLIHFVLKFYVNITLMVISSKLDQRQVPHLNGKAS